MMTNFAIIAVAAILIEALVEYAKTVMETLESREYKTFVTQVGTIILGVLIAWIFGAKLFSGVLDVQINEAADIIFSGIIMSRGSNYVSDFISRIKNGRTFEIAANEFDDDEFVEDADDDDEDYIEVVDDIDVTKEEGVK